MKTNNFISLSVSSLLFMIFISSISFVSSSSLVINYYNDTEYYEEKYFRLLSNSYDDIEQGVDWTQFGDSNGNGIGFEAQKDFGSIILLKDWSMYSFKLTKIVFRSVCSIDIGTGGNCAEMWLYHTKDNGYYSPSRKIFLKQNYLIIVVQFKKVVDSHPGKSDLFELLRLNDFSANKQTKSISPSKPVRLYQIIQDQPSYLFEGTLNNTNQECLFLVFSKYHFISEKEFNILQTETNGNVEISDHGTIYRNVINFNELKPMGTLLAYTKKEYLKYYALYFLILFLLF